MAFKCPYCENEGTPLTSTRVSTTGWILFVVLLIVCFPICWIPFLVSGCKEEVRKCASCGSLLGTSA